MPVLFWVLFLVCVWGVLCDDLALLPVAVVTGSLCAQTHIPYLGIVGGLVAVMAVSLALAYRRDRRAKATTPSRRSIVAGRPSGAALGALIWLPVFVDELGGDPGNISIIVDSFRHAEDPVGLGYRGLLVEHLNPLRLVQGDRVSVPVAHGPAWRRWPPGWPRWSRRCGCATARCSAAHCVGTALVLGLVSVSRILGVAWFYLTLWASAPPRSCWWPSWPRPRRSAPPCSPGGAGQRPPSLAWLPILALGVAVLWPTLALAKAPRHRGPRRRRLRRPGPGRAADRRRHRRRHRPGGPRRHLHAHLGRPGQPRRPGLGPAAGAPSAAATTRGAPAYRLAVRDHRASRPPRPTPRSTSARRTRQHAWPPNAPAPSGSCSTRPRSATSRPSTTGCTTTSSTASRSTGSTTWCRSSTRTSSCSPATSVRPRT